MPVYANDETSGHREIDHWDGGVGWFVHPSEAARRASHAIRGADGGAWLFDPLDAPGVDDLVAELGEVASVAVLSNYHARDAGRIARRHDVPVHLPASMTRLADRIDAPVERYGATLGDSGFRVRVGSPLPGWRESVAYRPSDGTLYVPDPLGTAPLYRVADERLGVYLFGRPMPPRTRFAGLDPERLLVGHGTGVFEQAPAALSDALDGARRRFRGRSSGTGRRNSGPSSGRSVSERVSNKEFKGHCTLHATKRQTFYSSLSQIWVS